MTNKIEVTQADRDAAAQLADQIQEWDIAKNIREGKRDQYVWCQAFAAHRQYGYDQGYYDGCAHTMDAANRAVNVLREALEAAPLIGRTESVYDFMERQNAWLNGSYRAAMERSK